MIKQQKKSKHKRVDESHEFLKKNRKREKDFSYEPKIKSKSKSNIKVKSNNKPTRNKLFDPKHILNKFPSKLTKNTKYIPSTKGISN